MSRIIPKSPAVLAALSWSECRRPPFAARRRRCLLGSHLWLFSLTALIVAVALPMSYYRNRIIEWFRRKQTDVG
jgi:hypothetical protein